MPTLVSLLWHMHQPYYKDIVQDSYVMPWAYLHGTKDYLRMVELSAQYPDIHQTFNLVPSLIVQLEEYARGVAKDPMLELAFKPAEDLDDAERALVLEKFFPVPVRTMVEPYPRYRELMERRSGDDLSVQDIRDIQVWWSLAWMDWERQPRGLVDKGKNFSRKDQADLRLVVSDIIQSIVPAYRRAQDEGTIEVSTTPFFHPILPLLIDSRVDDGRVPVQVQLPEDAGEQLRRARNFMKERFGRQPAGLWPSEGSVSDAVASAASREGFDWMATDESILAKSGVQIHDHFRGRLYRPYSRDGITIFFRDRNLSDLIGFHYMHSNPRDAAADLIRRLKDVPDGTHVTIALDGENPWDYYPANGRDFLRHLFEGISREPGLEAVTLSEARSRLQAAPLDWLAPGSWANANFAIWMGHPEDYQAWQWIVRARTALMERRDAVPHDRWDMAYEELLVAEGSDWMWWFGNEFTSESDAIFDGLFRRHIGNIYYLIGLPYPEGLELPIKRSLGGRNTVMVPNATADPPGP
jgi:alpha-amylase/alpha-mannosidase (GH57 family)